MAVVHTTRGELPDARALVYEECTRQLLIQWEAERSVLGQSQRTDLRTALEVAEVTLYNALQEVAYHAHERQAGDPKRGGAALVTEDLLRADLWAAFDDEAKVRTFLSYCESANGLLLWQGVAPLPDAPPDSPPRRVYAFPHLTFQEYLAARYLGRMANLGEKARLHLDRSDRWREVVMLLGEHICFRDGNYEQMDALLNALAPDPFPAQPSPQDWRALWMAGDLLMLYRRAFPRRGEQHGRIPHGLARLLKSGALTSIERAAAGGALARLGQEGAGDPRFDPQRLYLPSRADSLDDPLQLPDLWGFIHIPAGPFLMGSRRDDPGARENEFEQHVLELPDYYLARYPVTVAQFRLFVECTGYKVRDSDSLRGLSNHPVNWITWYEARDYCRWLDGELKAAAARRLEQAAALPPAEALFCRRLAQDGWQITIPSEAEWEKAARGPLPGAAPATSPSLSVSSLAPATPPSLSVSEREGGWGDERGRLYPWGFTFSSDCANTKETGLDAISPVGCFPQGQSVYGLLDMSGNVWEWTRSQYCSYPYDPQDGRETPPSSNDVWMAVRGGAYYSEPQSARCAFRFGDDPDLRLRYYGFRVVLLLCR